MTRAVRFAIAIALAIAGVAMVSHHAAGVGHETVAHDHAVVVHAHDAVAHHDAGAPEPLGTFSAGSGATSCTDCDHGSPTDALLMGCAALLVALLAALRVTRPEQRVTFPSREGSRSALIHPPRTTTPAPALEQLSVLRL